MPDGFERYRRHFPETVWREPVPGDDRADAFQVAWHARASPPSSLAVVLTPGLFAECLPSCFDEARRSFTARGHRCLRTPVATRHDAMTQAWQLASHVGAWLRPGERFIWCTHSKGGIDALLALERHERLREGCRALVLVQMPVGISHVVEELRGDARPLPDRVLAMLSRSAWFAAGIDEISRTRPPALADWLASVRPSVPTLQVLTWSVEPTHRIDTWHRRLARLRPGHAHDGQFLLADQRLDGVPLVGLPALDHAQPVLGGGGLDTGRLWSALATLAYREGA